MAKKINLQNALFQYHRGSWLSTGDDAGGGGRDGEIISLKTSMKDIVTSTVNSVTELRHCIIDFASRTTAV